MLRIPFDEMKGLFARILVSRGLEEGEAETLASIVATNSLEGVYSHGTNRFPRLVHDIECGTVDKDAKIEKVIQAGSMECWNGHFGIGPLNAWKAMERACGLAHEHGMGLVALGWNNHWLRGSTYGRLAAARGCIGICWSNTKPNMPVWGGTVPKIGNNPLIISVPKADGAHFVFDSAMSQYSYGKLEEYRLKGEMLPYAGGFDDEGKLTCDPAVIERNGRMLPIGLWKGSGLSIALDLIATVLSGGASVTQIGQMGNERGLTQIMIAIEADRLGGGKDVDRIVSTILGDLKSGEAVRYPGERLERTRKENLEAGIPVDERIWTQIEELGAGC